MSMKINNYIYTRFKPFILLVGMSGPRVLDCQKILHRSVMFIRPLPSTMSYADSIWTLQHSRRPTSQSKQDYTFYWLGKQQDEPRLHGVGFAIKNSLLNTIEPPMNGSEHILSIRLSTSSGPVNLLSVYTPIHSAEIKVQFYEELNQQHLQLRALVLTWRLQCQSWGRPRLVASLPGIENINENGQQLYWS